MALHHHTKMFQELLSKNERVLHPYAKGMDGDDYGEYAKCEMEILSYWEL